MTKLRRDGLRAADFGEQVLVAPGVLDDRARVDSPEHRCDARIDPLILSDRGIPDG